mgnify:CR=1 FL=1
MDSTRRALVDTLTAQLTLLRIDIGKVVVDGDSSKGAYLLALATADTASLARLHHHSTAILRAASHIYGTVLRPLLTQLEKSFGAGLNARTTRCTLVGIDLHEACLVVYV